MLLGTGWLWSCPKSHPESPQSRSNLRKNFCPVLKSRMFSAREQFLLVSFGRSHQDKSLYKHIQKNIAVFTPKIHKGQISVRLGEMIIHMKYLVSICMYDKYRLFSQEARLGTWKITSVQYLESYFFHGHHCHGRHHRKHFKGMTHPGKSWNMSASLGNSFPLKNILLNKVPRTNETKKSLCGCCPLIPHFCPQTVSLCSS